jgi:hypothetical protein
MSPPRSLTAQFITVVGGAPLSLAENLCVSPVFKVIWDGSTVSEIAACYHLVVGQREKSLATEEQSKEARPFAGGGYL